MGAYKIWPCMARVARILFRVCFDPHPQGPPIFHLILCGRSESLLMKPAFPYLGSESPGIAVGAVCWADQVLLSKNCHQETWYLTEEIWGWGWGSKLTFIILDGRFARIDSQIRTIRSPDSCESFQSLRSEALFCELRFGALIIAKSWV